MLTDFIKVMQNHIGKANAISGEDLARAVGVSPRELRKMTGMAINDSVALCSHPANGYWIAQDAA